MGRDELDVIRPFLRRIQERVAPERIVLFGSRSDGTASESSDYDVLVVSDAFEGMSMHERMATLYREQPSIDADVELLCVTPDEAERRSEGEHDFVARALEQGRDITAVV